MDSITLKPLGDVTICEPPNWCAIADLSTAWVKISEDNADILRTRVCAAGIGIVWDTKNKSATVPAYDWKRGNVYTYGAVVEDALLRRGVTVSDMMMAGIAVFSWLQELIPTTKDVEETTDFIEAGEELKI